MFYMIDNGLTLIQKSISYYVKIAFGWHQHCVIQPISQRMAKKNALFVKVVLIHIHS